VVQDASTLLAGCEQVASESLSETETETETEKRQKTIEILFELPQCINQELWEAYKEMRKKKKANMTDKARDILIRDLCKWSAQGYDINAILERSITQNWTGLFLPKDDQSKPHILKPVTASMSPAERTRQSIAEFEARQKPQDTHV
jgi:hypothetical protein